LRSAIDHGVYPGYYAIGAVDHSAAIRAMRQVKLEQSPPDGGFAHAVGDAGGHGARD
jgi:hypothetical protein